MGKEDGLFKGSITIIIGNIRMGDSQIILSEKEIIHLIITEEIYNRFKRFKTKKNLLQ